MFCCLTFALTITLPRLSFSADDEVEQARAHVRKATAAYNLGQYTEAATEYETAYKKTLDPNMLFNVGQAWRQAGDKQKALTAYRSYLRTSPTGEQREVALSKVKELEGQRADDPPVPSHPVPAEPAPSNPISASVSSSGAASAPSDGQHLTSDPAVMATSATAVAVPVAPDDSGSATPKPFYARWPFWTVIGAVLVAGAVTAIVLGSRGGGLDMPNTDYGTKHF